MMQLWHFIFATDLYLVLSLHAFDNILPNWHKVNLSRKGRRVTRPRKVTTALPVVITHFDIQHGHLICSRRNTQVVWRVVNKIHLYRFNYEWTCAERKCRWFWSRRRCSGPASSGESRRMCIAPGSPTRLLAILTFRCFAKKVTTINRVWTNQDNHIMLRNTLEWRYYREFHVQWQASLILSPPPTYMHIYTSHKRPRFLFSLPRPAQCAYYDDSAC